MITMDTTEAVSPFEAWQEGTISAREAVRQLVAAQLVAADAAYKAAEQRRKMVRDQLTTLMLELREPITASGLVLEYREGSLSASYPVKKVDAAIVAVMEIVAALRATPLSTEAEREDTLPAYRIEQGAIDDLLQVIQELAGSREERARAGALYVTKEGSTR